MAKTNVKIDIPTKRPNDLISLGEKIVKHNAELKTNSPLMSLNMNALTKALAEAKDKKEKARKLHDEAEKLNQEADLALGVNKTQNSKTPDTVLNIVTSARDVLLGLNRGREEKLNEWGFKVVNTSTTSATKKAKQ